MALDEVLARQVVAGRRPPTLRIWEWSAPAVTAIGPRFTGASASAERKVR